MNPGLEEAIYREYYRRKLEQLVREALTSLDEWGIRSTVERTIEAAKDDPISRY